MDFLLQNVHLIKKYLLPEKKNSLLTSLLSFGKRPNLLRVKTPKLNLHLGEDSSGRTIKGLWLYCPPILQISMQSSTFIKKDSFNGLTTKGIRWNCPPIQQILTKSSTFISGKTQVVEPLRVFGLFVHQSKKYYHKV